MPETIPTPIVKKIAISPIQQRIPAINDDRTLSFALHGELNRIILSLTNVTNYNADAITLIVDALARIGVLVKRFDDIEKVQADIQKDQAAAKAEAALVNSYTDPTTILSAITTNSGADASVTVLNHNRIYADDAKTTVAVVGKTFANMAINTVYYLYYDDPTRAGGAVDIKISTNNLDAAQTGVRHSLGSIMTPAADDTDPVDGGGVNPPGGGRYYPPGKQLSQE